MRNSQTLYNALLWDDIEYQSLYIKKAAPFPGGRYTTYNFSRDLLKIRQKIKHFQENYSAPSRVYWLKFSSIGKRFRRGFAPNSENFLKLLQNEDQIFVVSDIKILLPKNTL